MLFIFLPKQECAVYAGLLQTYDVLFTLVCYSIMFCFLLSVLFSIFTALSIYTYITCVIYLMCSLVCTFIFVQYKLFRPVIDVRSERFGEKALLENRDQRELRARLQVVEDELSQLHTSHELEVTWVLFDTCGVPFLKSDHRFCLLFETGFQYKLTPTYYGLTVKSL